MGERALDPEWLRPRVGGKRLLVGVCGGIAAYKTCTLVSRLAQAGAEVHVAMTEGAQRFVTPMTFQALSGRAVMTGVWDQIEGADPQHIRLADRLDAAIVAPATMDCLARLSSGRADDVVSLILAAVDRAKTPVILAPSMNAVMWSQASTRRNVETLKGDGFILMAPGEGWQACRHLGPGRLPEPEEIAAGLVEVLGTS